MLCFSCFTDCLFLQLVGPNMRFVCNMFACCLGRWFDGIDYHMCWFCLYYFVVVFAWRPILWRELAEKKMMWRGLVCLLIRWFCETILSTTTTKQIKDLFHLWLFDRLFPFFSWWQMSWQEHNFMQSVSHNTIPMEIERASCYSKL